MRRLCNDYGAYNEEGKAISDEAEPIIREWIEKANTAGIDLHDLSYILTTVVEVTISEFVLNNAITMRREERAAVHHGNPPTS